MTDLVSEPRYLRVSHVCQRYGDINPSTLYRWTNDSELAFPKPVYIRGLRLWHAADLDDFDARQAENRPRTGKQGTRLAAAPA